MKGFFCTLEFLTVLPVRMRGRWEDVNMPVWFPAAGLVLGLLWATCHSLLGQVFPVPLRAWLDVLVLVVLTGGLHLDGLADTADGLLAHRGPERALEIMRDSRSGVWGVLALVAVLGLKGTALASMWEAGISAAVLILIPAWARLAMLFVMHGLPYGRGTDGISHTMVDLPLRRWMWGAALAGIGFALLPWIQAVTMIACFGATVFLVLRWYRRSVGCYTGDMLGAIGEIVETVLLVGVCAGVG